MGAARRGKDTNKKKTFLVCEKKNYKFSMSSFMNSGIYLKAHKVLYFPLCFASTYTFYVYYTKGVDNSKLHLRKKNNKL